MLDLTLKLGVGIGNLLTSVALPAEFTAMPFNLFKSGSRYTTDYDYTADRPTGVEKWIDVVNGNDSNDGNTESSAYRTLAQAASAGANVYYIKSGYYLLNDYFTEGYEFTRDTALIAVDGPGTVLISNAHKADEFSWTDLGNGVYSTVYRNSNTFASDINTVVDMTYVNDSEYTLVDGTTPTPLTMTQQSSVANLNSSSGHGFYDPDTLELHIKTHDGREPDSDVIIMRMFNTTWTTNRDITLYMDGLEVWGRRPLTFGNNLGEGTGLFVAHKCGFRYSNGLGALVFDGVAETRLIGVKVGGSVNHDGISYNNNSSTAICRHLEVDCEGTRTGDNSSDQGSTGHDNRVSIVRLNGDYSNNSGHGTEETQGSQSANYGCKMNGNNGYGVRSTSGSKVWIQDCDLSGNGSGATDAILGTTLIDLGGNTLT